MALMVLMALILLGTAIISVADLEKRMSNYDYKTQQAQQAADAGVDWGIDMIYQQLKNSETTLQLPDLPIGNSARISLESDSNPPEAKLTLINKESQTSNIVKYSFVSTGIYQGAQKRVEVEITYSFIDFFNVDEEGQSVFRNHEFKDRGKITSYVVKTNVN